MAKANKLGLMEVSIREDILTARRMDMGLISGLIAVCILEIGKRILFMAKVLTNGQMELLIREIGKIMRWMGKDFILGKMEGLMKGAM